MATLKGGSHLFSGLCLLAAHTPSVPCCWWRRPGQAISSQFNVPCRGPGPDNSAAPTHSPTPNLSEGKQPTSCCGFLSSHGSQTHKEFLPLLQVCFMDRARFTGEFTKLTFQRHSLARPLPRPYASRDIHNFLFFL